MTRQAHSAYLSPTETSNGNGLEQWDRAYYRRTAEASDNLRRAIVRYYFRRDGVRL